MKVEHLTNSFAKFGTELSSQLSTCADFSIGSAFIGSSAIDLIEECLKKNKQLKSSKLLTSVYGYFNLKSDFIHLKSLAKKYPDKFKVHISRDKSFHWKYYQFEKQSINTTYVGSANFTNGGMGNNAELLIKITTGLKASNGPVQKLKSSFEKQWSNSGPISRFPIDFYPVISKEFNKFFSKKSKKRPEKINASENAVVFYLTDDLKASTYKKLYGYNPSWEENDIEFFVCNWNHIFCNVLMQKKYFLFQGWQEIHLFIIGLRLLIHVMI